MFRDLSRVRIIFFGTSEFAVPVLHRLATDANYEIVAVITQPDKPAGRKQEPLPSPVKVEVEKLALNILQPDKLTVYSLPPTADVFIVASYGQIIRREVLEIPKFGALNIHPSLLPKYRGPSPIQTAILNGDHETGVTIMKLDEELDHGPTLGNFKFQISNSKIK